ncbi:MAG TPA: 50S ribosomal protein L24 [Methylophilaceae bacterium]
MNKIRKGDQVIVTTGKDKGKRGAVLDVLPTGRLVVEGINKVKRHTRGNPMKGVAGGIIEQEMSLHISNVALFNGATQQASRVGFKTLDDGRKVRVFKSNGEVVDA